jgi:hypothetical protein
MNILLDALTDTTGWSGTGAVTVSTTQVNDNGGGYIAGDQTAALLIDFPAGSQGDGLSKTFAVDVSELDQLVVSYWSRNKRNGIYRTFNDCPYSLVINGTLEYGIRCWPSFTDETFAITDVDTITSIEFRAKHNDADSLVVSFMVVSKDELPLDIFTSLVTKLENQRDAEYPNGLLLGTLDATAGDTAIDVIGNVGHLWRYAVLYIDDTVNNETHQLADLTEDGFELTDLFDGRTILNTFSGASVYLQFPVNIYQTGKEIMFPSFTLYGMDVEPIKRGTEIEYPVRVLGSTDTALEHLHIYEWTITCDIASRSLELNAKLAEVFRRAMSKHTVWINGRKVIVHMDAPSSEELPTDSFDVIPRLAYTVTVEVKEFVVWNQKRPLANQATIAVTPVETLP